MYYGPGETPALLNHSKVAHKTHVSRSKWSRVQEASVVLVCEPDSEEAREVGCVAV